MVCLVGRGRESLLFVEKRSGKRSLFAVSANGTGWYWYMYHKSGGKLRKSLSGESRRGDPRKARSAGRDAGYPNQMVVMMRMGGLGRAEENGGGFVAISRPPLTPIIASSATI